MRCGAFKAGRPNAQSLRKLAMPHLSGRSFSDCPNPDKPLA